MPQLMNNNQNTQYSPQPDLANLLQSLLQSGVNKSLEPVAKVNAQTQQTLNPYQEGVKKALKQAGEQQTMEAVQQGVPTDHIVQQAGLAQPPMSMANQGQQGDAQQILTGLLSLIQQNGLQQPQQLDNNQINAQSPVPMKAKGMFSRASMTPEGNLIQEGSGNKILRTMLGLGGDSDVDAMYKASALQKLQGKEPLQAGEREKTQMALNSAEQIKQMDIQADYIKNLLKTPEALSPEAATKFTILLDGQKATKEVANLLKDKAGLPFQKWSPNIFNSDEGKKFKSAMLRMIDAKSRSESGAVISEKEFDKEFKKFGINIGDSKEVVRSKLSPLYEWYSSALNMSDPSGIHRQRADGQQTQQMSLLDAIKAEKKRRGL